jgi:probable rRNA maturation factor
MSTQGGKPRPEGGKSKRKSAPNQKRSAKSSAFKIDATNQQNRWPVKIPPLESALRSVLEGEGIRQADISLAIVDDPTIHQINKQFLEHDEPTDVISFLLEQDGDRLDGDILISADTAAHSADEYSWNLADELLLYTIHGMLHLVGYDDLVPAKKRQMRQKERHYLAKFGLKPRYKLNSGIRGGEEKTPVAKTRAKTDGRKRARRSK